MATPTDETAAVETPPEFYAQLVINNSAVEINFIGIWNENDINTLDQANFGKEQGGDISRPARSGKL